jgi:hypothetical protein
MSYGSFREFLPDGHTENQAISGQVLFAPFP